MSERNLDVQIAEIERDLEELDSLRSWLKQIRYFDSKRKVWMPVDKLDRLRRMNKELESL